jgi:hypothetical protein
MSKKAKIPEEVFFSMGCIDGSKLTDRQWEEALRNCVDFYNAKYGTELDRDLAFTEYLRRDFEVN